MTDKPRHNWTELLKRLWIVYAVISFLVAISFQWQAAAFCYNCTYTFGDKWQRFSEFNSRDANAFLAWIFWPVVTFWILQWIFRGLKKPKDAAGPSE